MSAAKVTVSGLSGRYATALFELAGEADALTKVEDELAGLARLAGECEDFAAFIGSPVLGRETQGKAVAAVAEKLELSDLTSRLLGVLAANRRLAALPGIARDFATLMAAHRGEVTAEVTSARPLDAAGIEKLANKLKAIAGSDVRIETEVDERLIGGLVVRLGSKMIDTSVATRLAGLERAMKGM